MVNFDLGLAGKQKEKAVTRNIFWYTQAVKEKMQHLNFAKTDMYCILTRVAKCLREHIILHIYLVKKWPIIVIKTYTSEKKKVLACKSELCAFISL